MDDTLNIISCNVRGLVDHVKRREFFHYFNTKPYNIILAQETHSSKFLESRWGNEWGSRIIFSHGTNLARGTMILIKRKSRI